MPGPSLSLCRTRPTSSSLFNACADCPRAANGYPGRRLEPPHTASKRGVHKKVPIDTDRMIGTYGLHPSRRSDVKVNARRSPPTSHAMPNDLGLLPGTLIMPTGSNRPTILAHPGRILQMEYQRALKRLKDWASVAFGVKFKTWRPSGWINLEWRKTGATADGLYRQMYSALANRDKKTIESLCCDGLRSTLKNMLTNTEPGTKYRWTVVRDLSPPKVVSHRATTLPKEALEALGTSEVTIRQAVVRIRTWQRLTILKARPEETAPEGREVTEYVVIQKIALSGEERDWMVWGTVEETKLAEWDEALNPSAKKQYVGSL